MRANLIKKDSSIKKDTTASVFSCECCEIFQYSFSAEHVRVTTSALQSTFSYNISSNVCDNFERLIRTTDLEHKTYSVRTLCTLFMGKFYKVSVIPDDC